MPISNTVLMKENSSWGGAGEGKCQGREWVGGGREKARR